jgi:2Fe-2S ferredoxin
MGGSNPYIEKSETIVAQKPFKVTFITPGEPIEIKVDPEKLPFGETGLVGSLLDIALGTCLRRGLRLLHVPRHRKRRPRNLQRPDG